MSYWDRPCAAKESLLAELTRRGVDPRYLDFGGPGQKPFRTPTVPTDARSEFLANRAMGDWAENLLLSPEKQKFIVHARETAVYRPFGSEPA